MEIQENILEIAERTSAITGRTLKPETLSSLSRADNIHLVADATMKFSVKGHRRRDDCVIILSNPAFPNAVSVAAEKAAEVAKRLPADLGQAVLLPLYVGCFGERSFAVYPRLFPFSNHPIARKFQKCFFEAGIYGWLASVAGASKSAIEDRSEIERRFVQPLTYIVDEPRFSDRARGDAEAALSEADGADFSPTCVIEHGDFWLGNILLTSKCLSRSEQRGFAVIDWGSCRIFGYPFADLLRFYDSSSNRIEKLTYWARKYCTTVGFERRHIKLYVLAALGHLGLHRDQFPFNRYLDLVERQMVIAQKVQFALAGEL